MSGDSPLPEFLLWQSILFEVGILLVSLLIIRFSPWQNAMEWLEARARWLSEQPVLCMAVLAAVSLLLRLALLAVRPVPQPLFHDEFSYLLGEDTFFHGRLTNPQPAVPQSFETIHENLWPTYQSMYLPGPALVLALGRLLGSPWMGVLLTTAAFCSALYWMTSAYLPRVYGLLAGGVGLAITSNLHWWFDNYFVIALSALGTTLVLGSLPGLWRQPTIGRGIPFAMGLVMLMMTRPYEGLCVVLPAIVLVAWRLRRAGGRAWAQVAVLPCLVIGLALAWLLYGNWRGTGHALLFPYALNFREYHITGPFLWSAKRSLPVYRLDGLRHFYTGAELPQYEFTHIHPVKHLLDKVWMYYYNFLLGFGLLLFPGLLYLWRHRHEDLLMAPLLGFAGFTVSTVLMAWHPFPQYAAPAAPMLMLVVVLGVFALRRCHWRQLGGVALVRGMVLGELMLWFSLFGLRIADAQDFQEPQYVTKDRARVMETMLLHPGNQLALVRYAPGHEAWQEWVFNGADVSHERVIWARSLDPETDRRLIAAYPHREVWLVRPDRADELVRPLIPADLEPMPRQAVGMPATALPGGPLIQQTAAQIAATGAPPPPRLAVHDIFSENGLPPLENGAGDKLLVDVAPTQVMERAVKLGVTGGQSATAAWRQAETTWEAARTRVEAALPESPAVFNGATASQLNEMLSQPTVHAVRVTRTELEVDTPVRLTRSDVTLDLGSTRLQGSKGPYLLRISGAHGVRVHGGVFAGGRGGVLIADSAGVTVDGAEFAGLNGPGVVVVDAEDVVMWGNRLHGLRGAGVLLGGRTSRTIVAQNTIDHGRGFSNWAAGVVVTDRQVALADDPANLFTADGYWAKNQLIRSSTTTPQNNLILDNDISDATTSGVYVDGGVRNVIEGNRIERNAKEGICLDYGSTANVVAWNTIRSNGKRWGMGEQELERDFIKAEGRLPDHTAAAKVPAISMDNAAYNQVVFNSIEDNFGGGIKMVRTSMYNIVGLNTLIDNNEGQSEQFHFFGIELGAAPGDDMSKDLDFLPSRGNIVFGNTVRGNHYAGIFFAAGSDHNNIFDNTIFGAKMWAMESVSGQANSTLNNLTNLPTRNVSPGLQRELALPGENVVDTPPKR